MLKNLIYFWIVKRHPMKIGFVLSLFSFALLFSSCDSQEPEQNGYSFFVAGHVYGKAIWGDMVAEPGMHPPFVNKIDYINSKPEIELGFFTGDVVQNTTQPFWDSFNLQREQFDFSTFIAPGNHDIAEPNPYPNDQTFIYKAVKHNDDLYLVLNTNNPAWQVDSSQVAFFRRFLNSNSDAKNIFVFAHHLLFWEKEGRFGAFEPNWFEDKPATTNFNTEVLPLFEGKGDHVYFFFGDVGARDGMQLFYSNEGHHSYIASGMGGFERDNFLIVNIADDSSIEIEVVYLNDVGEDISTQLQDYEWPD